MTGRITVPDVIIPLPPVFGRAPDLETWRWAIEPSGSSDGTSTLCSESEDDRSRTSCWDDSHVWQPADSTGIPKRLVPLTPTNSKANLLPKNIQVSYMNHSSV